VEPILSFFPFPSIAAATVFYIIFISWILLGNAPRNAPSGNMSTRGNDHSSVFVAVGALVSVVLSFFFSVLQVAIWPSWTYYLGIVLMLSGIIVRQWAVKTLSNFFTSALGVQEGQGIVDKGPYRFVRHPAYSGSIMSLLGVSLALQSWGGF
jgi:protein-S-isoprenylcysteine O-methyltransferase Ste14